MYFGQQFNQTSGIIVFHSFLENHAAGEAQIPPTSSKYKQR
jgi:hypothetical protein